MRACFPCVFLLVFASAPAFGADRPDPAAAEFFEKQVRPLLIANCQGCHSGKKKRGNLLLDSRAGLLKGGDTGPAVVPGSPEKSLLVQAVSYREQLRMPPRSKLPDEQIATLRKWVEMGAPWPGSDQESVGEAKIDLNKRLAHWSFQPVRRAVVPAVKKHGWTTNALDRFLLAKMEEHRCSPAGQADRRTIARRLTFDLTGLPITPFETRAFLEDESPDAYAKLVDRLLASPAYGERWGRHWLDLMRFAETAGHEFDFDIPEADGYRDYIIRALNDDLRYDVLVREHVAGDLMREPRRRADTRTNESILGTGFWMLGESKHSPVDLRSDGADRRDNMIDVFGKAFLGLTISCARCHDHKFDPITTREYYSLASYLQSARMQRAFLDPPELLAEPIARLRELRRKAATMAIRRSVEVLQKYLTDDKLIASGSPDLERDYPLFEDFSHGDYRGWFVTGHAFGQAPATALDVEIDPKAAVPVRRLIRGANTKAVSTRLAGALRSRTFTIDKKFIHYQIRGKCVRVNLILDGFQLIQEPIYGGLRFSPNESGRHVQDVSMWRGLKGYIEVLDEGDGEVELQEVRFSDRREPPPVRRVQGDGKKVLREWGEGKSLSRDERDVLDALLRAASVRPQSVSNASNETPVANASGSERGGSALEKILTQITTLEHSLPRPSRGLALADGTPVKERVHIRGNPKRLGEEAPHQLPAAVAGVQPMLTDRREMAERLTAPDNPLLARVLVNRLWHHHFGQGLVRSTDDFGHQGDRPTHPGLLDWLAGELIDSGWSLKHMHRLMLLSSAYRMSSRGEEVSAKADPQNRLLHRMPIRRLEAEAIRDAMLAVSGRLDRTMFGRGPGPHLTEFLVGRGRPTSSGPLDGAGRRSVYLNVRRNFLDPMFLAFDYPVPATAMGRRSVSNVPAQALTLLNNPFVIGEARRWAGRGGGAGEERVRAMYEAAYGREATAEEVAQALAFVAGQGGAWADLAHVLFNVKEFIFVN